MMPTISPAGAILGCAILLFLAAIYILGFVAVGLGIWSWRKRRPATAWFVRRIGAVCFVIGLLGLFVYSHFSYDSMLFMLVLNGSLSLVGLLAWLLGLHAASRREVWIGSIAAVICTAAALGMVWYDSDYRVRRDALFSAALRGNAQEVRKLLATGLSPDLADSVGTRLLEKATDAPTAAAVIAAGAKVREASRALAYAAQQGNLPIVKLLLAHGADPNARFANYPAAKLAWWNDHRAILELLRKAGAADAERLQRLTGVLLSAVKAGDAEAVKRALAGEYRYQERTEGLRFAAASGNVEVAMILVRATDAHREIAEAALIAARHDRVEMFDALMEVLESRQPGYILRETKAAALSIVSESGSPKLRARVAARGWDKEDLPSSSDGGVRALLRNVN